MRGAKGTHDYRYRYSRASHEAGHSWMGLCPIPMAISMSTAMGHGQQQQQQQRQTYCRNCRNPAHKKLLTNSTI